MTPLFSMGWWGCLVAGVVGSMTGLSACSEGDDSLMGPEPGSVPGCEREEFGPCDILDRSCQKRVLSTVSCIRESKDVVLPPVRTITESEYATELTAYYEEASDEDASDAARYEAALVLIGLADSGEFAAENRAALFAGSVTAAYSNLDKDVVIVEHPEAGSRSSDADETLTLAHEFIHALQDQEHDLAQLYEDHSSTYDAYLALRCVFEGEAVVLTSLWRAALWALSPTADDFRARYMAWVSYNERKHLARTPLLSAPLYFPYTYGARYVYDLYADAGMEAVRQLYEDVPDSTLPFMLSGSGAEAVEVAPFEDRSILAPEGFELADQDSLGAWILEKFLVRNGRQTDATTLARSWAGDRLYVFSSADGRTASAWRLRLASRDAAGTLADQVSTLTSNVASNWDVVRIDGDVLIIAAENAAARNAWATTLTETADSAASVAAVNAGQARVPTGRLARFVRRRAGL